MPGKVWRPRVLQSRFKSREYYIVIGSDMLGGELISIRVEIFDRSDQISAILICFHTQLQIQDHCVYLGVTGFIRFQQKVCVCTSARPVWSILSSPQAAAAQFYLQSPVVG